MPVFNIIKFCSADGQCIGIMDKFDEVMTPNLAMLIGFVAIIFIMLCR